VFDPEERLKRWEDEDDIKGCINNEMIQNEQYYSIASRGHGYLYQKFITRRNNGVNERYLAISEGNLQILFSITTILEKIMNLSESVYQSKKRSIIAHSHIFY